MGMENVKIAAVCDPKEDRARAAAEKTGAQIVRDFDETIARADIDAVHILTPHFLHAPMAIAALRAGKHVLTEKPMATTLQDARAMIAAARGSEARLGVIFQNRYNPATVELKRFVASGAGGALLGARATVAWKREAPYYLESGWRGTMATEGGGSLINQSIHTLDLLSYIAGRPIARVRGHVSTDLLSGTVEVETSCHAVAEYEGGGRIVIFTTNDYALDAPVTIEFACEKKRWQIVGDELYDATDGMTLLLDGKPPTVSGKAYWGAGHAAEIRDFYDCLETGRPFMLEGAAGYPALNLVKAIQQSSATGEWVALNDPKEI
jgi:predicted dehydrogenase